MLSEYLRIREKNGMVAAFHELHPIPLYCTKEKWASFLSGQPMEADFIEGLKSRKLIIDSEAVDRLEYEEASARLIHKHSQAETLYLMMAQGCNFDCAYCFIPEFARVHGSSMLSESDAVAGIDLWFEHIRETYDPERSYCVIFYGGEPLLNKPVILKSLEYLRRKKAETGLPRSLELLMVTNGALVDDTVVSMCREYGIMVAVSLDGSKRAHDAMRVDASGQGTYDAVVGSIRSLVKAGIRTFGSVTVTPANMGELKQVANLLSGLGVEKFGFNLVKGKKLIEMVGKDGVEEYGRAAAKAILEYYRDCRPGFEYQLEKKADAFDRQDFFPHDCTCYGSQLVIQPDGQVSNCPFFKAGIGHVQTALKGFRIWDQSIVKEWRKRLPLYNKGFEGNDAKALCGPGCAWGSLELHGDILAVDETNATLGKEAFDELIWSKLRQ